MKWSRRHRMVVFNAVGLLLSMALIGPAVAVNQARLRVHAEQETNRAEGNLDLALRAVDEMYTQLADEYLTTTPVAEPMKLAYFERATAFYSTFVAENACFVFKRGLGPGCGLDTNGARPPFSTA